MARFFREPRPCTVPSGRQARRRFVTSRTVASRLPPSPALPPEGGGSKTNLRISASPSQGKNPRLAPSPPGEGLGWGHRVARFFREPRPCTVPSGRQARRRFVTSHTVASRLPPSPALSPEGGGSKTNPRICLAISGKNPRLAPSPSGGGLGWGHRMARFFREPRPCTVPSGKQACQRFVA